MTVNDGVKELRKALSLSQQAFATELGMSIRAVVNYEKDRLPTPHALAQLERLATQNDQLVLARMFSDELARHLGLGMSDRPPVSSEEVLLDRAFRRCAFENPESQVAKQIRRLLQPFVLQIKKEDESSLKFRAKLRE